MSKCIVGLFDVCLMVFNATFNNISVISWRSFLLVEETGGPEENHLSQVTDKLYHKMLYTSPWSRFELTTSMYYWIISHLHLHPYHFLLIYISAQNNKIRKKTKTILLRIRHQTFHQKKRFLKFILPFSYSSWL